MATDTSTFKDQVDQFLRESGVELVGDRRRSLTASYPVPDPEAFYPDGLLNPFVDFLPDPRLDALGARLIEQHADLFHSHGDFRIVYRWKREGGASNGAPTFGKCQKLSGALKHFSEADYLIWLAADHCRDHGLSHHQINALMFHELHHIELDPDTDKPALRPHDFEGFTEELLRYGFWMTDLVRLGETVRQVPLDLEPQR